MTDRPLVTYDPGYGRENPIVLHEQGCDHYVTIEWATRLRDALTAALDRAAGHPCSTGPVCEGRVW